MSIPSDAVTNTYFEFLLRDGVSVLREVAASVSDMMRDLGPRIHVPHGVAAEAESLDDIDATSDYLMARIEAVAREHDRARLLLLFRKTPSAVVRELLHVDDDPVTYSRVFSEGMLFGTNCVLTFSPERDPMTPNQRFDFRPTERELADALRLAVLAFLHRTNVFHANYVARRAVTSAVSHDALVSSYNERQERARVEATTRDSSAMIAPVLAATLPRAAYAPPPPWNWIPVLMPMDAVKDAYGYLAKREASAKFLGCGFEAWLQIWTLLNRVLGQGIGMLGNRTADGVELVKYRQAEYGTSAMTGSPIQSLFEATYGTAVTMNETTTSLEEWRAAFTRLIYSGHCTDVRFPEQPFIFYRFAGGLELWDGLRHLGMLRSVARLLSQGGGDMRAQGRALEMLLIRSLSETFGIASVSRIRLKERRQDVGDVDVAFAWRGVLFAVEVKNEFKNIGYFFEGKAVAHRVDKVRAYRDHHDEMLHQYRDVVRKKVPAAQQTTGMIGVVCTREIEFVPSFGREWWLTDVCPRVCSLAEFLEALPHVDDNDLRSHPSFIPWE
jgi:hypothetical protein